MFVAEDGSGNLVDIDDALFETSNNYYCPQCKASLIIKNGNIKVSHFAHVSLKDCDSFSGDMSEWHREWQKAFLLENREVVIEYNGALHRADICLGNYIIEFQNSIISEIEFDERNSFYTRAGYKVIWIFNFIDEYEEGKMKCYGENHWKSGSGGKYAWKYPCRFMRNWNPKVDRDVQIYFQISGRDDENDSESSYMEQVTWVIEEDGYANFKRFCTSYNITNITELKEYIEKGQRN